MLPVCGPLRPVMLGSQADAVHSTQRQPALVHAALCSGSQCPDPPAVGRGQPDLPATPQQPAEPTVMGQFLPHLRFGEALICEVFLGYGNADSGGKQKKERTDRQKHCTLYWCQGLGKRDTCEVTVISYPQARPPRWPTGLTHTHTRTLTHTP